MTGIATFLSQLPPGFWTLMVTLAGGVLLKIAEKWINSGKEARDGRDELRKEIDKLRQRMDTMQTESDDWRAKYYLNEEEIAILRAFIRGLGNEPPARKNNPLYDESKYMYVPVSQVQSRQPETPAD